PSGLLREHRIAEGVWGRLVVRDGALTFVFDGETASPSSLVTAPGEQIIPPGVPHHVVIGGAVRFVVEFYRPPAGDTVTA
ncbi:MAG: DUF1971 domain-containing protein, partial [Ilumatobacter sp.]|nr:DUF1971 domain-containing protein [Ilumatobacter sp.]